ncbi:MAG TPA: hypothetical protein VGG71_13235 [Chitinophagaceae bacterium]
MSDLQQKDLLSVHVSNRISIWVIIGYISSFFGGLLGIVIGSVLLTAKKALRDGQVLYVFNEPSRKHGRIILYLGSVVLILSILFFMNWFFLEKILFGKR